MAFLESASIRAAWRADFNQHLPLREAEMLRLCSAKGRRHAPGVIAGLRSLFGPGDRFSRTTPDTSVPRITSFMPPF